jgi:hypothetical protein
MAHRSLAALRSPLLIALLAVPIAVMLASAYRNQPGEATVTVQPGQQFQVIHGWEAVAQASLEELDKVDNRQEVLDELFDKAVDFGLTRLRLEAKSAIEHTRDIAAEYAAGRISREEERCARYSTVNDNNDPNVLNPRGFIWTKFDREVREAVVPMARRLESRGEKLWLNVQYTAFTDMLCRGYGYEHDRPEEYAEFVLAVFEHLRDTFGLVPDSWELMLEPDNTRIWTPARLAEAAEAAHRRLLRAGFSPTFVGPGVTNAGNTLGYLDAFWRREPLRSSFKELSYHRYSGATRDTVAAVGRAVTERGIASSMLEKIGAGVDELHEDLTEGRVSAWQQFALSWPDRDTGAHYFILDPTRPAGERALLSSTGSYLRQYFRALRPGARRIGALTDGSGFEAVAAMNPGERMAVVVRARRAGRLTLANLAPGTYRTSCWTDRASWDRDPDPCAGDATVDESGSAVLTMPDAGVFSLVQQVHVER